MKVIRKADKPASLKLPDLSNGEVFHFEGQTMIFLKVSDEFGINNINFPTEKTPIICLETGRLYRGSKDANVIRLNGNFIEE